MTSRSKSRLNRTCRVWFRVWIRRRRYFSPTWTPNKSWPSFNNWSNPNTAKSNLPSANKTSTCKARMRSNSTNNSSNNCKAKRLRNRLNWTNKTRRISMTKAKLLMKSNLRGNKRMSNSLNRSSTKMHKSTIVWWTKIMEKPEVNKTRRISKMKTITMARMMSGSMASNSMRKTRIWKSTITNSIRKSSRSLKNNSEMPKTKPPKKIKAKQLKWTKMMVKILMIISKTTLTTLDKSKSKT